MVQIVDVTCPTCNRKFRTVPSVLEHAGAVRCSACGSLMHISDPQPVAILNTRSDAA